MKKALVLGVLSLTLGMASQGAQALSGGQTDTFAGPSLDNWFAGGITGNFPPTPPQAISTGGPAGAGDAYMLITAVGGTGAGSRLVVLNGAQWAGNYLSSGIPAIAMDLKNFGATDLTIRLLFEDPVGAPPVDEAVTTAGVFLPAGSGWTHAIFNVSPASFTALSGSVTTLLSQTTILRIIDAPTAGDAISLVGTLGVDNVTAVPEPETYALMLGGLALLGWRKTIGVCNTLAKSVTASGASGRC